MKRDGIMFVMFMMAPVCDISNLKTQISNSKSQIPNLKSQISKLSSHLNFRISDFRSRIDSKKRVEGPRVDRALDAGGIGKDRCGLLVLLLVLGRAAAVALAGVFAFAPVVAGLAAALALALVLAFAIVLALVLFVGGKRLGAGLG